MAEAVRDVALRVGGYTSRNEAHDIARNPCSLGLPTTANALEQGNGA
jgi:hypothetical protein